jgi:hypothetical protein
MDSRMMLQFKHFCGSMRSAPTASFSYIDERY